MPDHVIATDSSKYGYRGVRNGCYFRGKFPGYMRHENIAYLEILAVFMAVRIWQKELKGKYFWIHIDNEAVTTVLNTGAARDVKLQNCLCEIALIAARNEFVLKAKHIIRISNRVPDWLSRWNEQKSKTAFRQYAQEKSLKSQGHSQNACV